MYRSILLASAIALGSFGAAYAQSSPRLIGTGDNAQLVYEDSTPHALVGGGSASLRGTGDNAQLSYGSTIVQPGTNPGSLASQGSFGRTPGYVPNHAGQRQG